MSTPTCPQCGQSRFQMTTTQQIDVLFHAETSQGEAHTIVDGPRGGLDWEDKTMAICCNCGHSDELGRMTCVMKTMRARVYETIEQATYIELENVPEFLVPGTDEFDEFVKTRFQAGEFKGLGSNVLDVTSCSIDDVTQV